MTDEQLVAIQIDNAKKAQEHHAQFAASYAEMARLATGFERDEYTVQADFHARKAEMWGVRLAQLERR